MTIQQEKQAFLEVLKVDRCDRTTRLIFADWLEDHGLDDEAVEQRRMSTKEWVAAARWMEGIVKVLGDNCYNYDDTYRRDLDGTWVKAQEEKWQEFTFDQVVEIAQHYVDTIDEYGGGEKFVQQGSETARYFLSALSNREAFWKAWRTITGNDPGEAAKEGPFCCTC